MQQENMEGSVKASISSERSKDEKWRWEQSWGHAKPKTQEAGDWERNLYLLTSSSDSSVSERLSKSRHGVRRSLEHSAVCIFVLITRGMQKESKSNKLRSEGKRWKKKQME